MVPRTVRFNCVYIKIMNKVGKNEKSTTMHYQIHPSTVQKKKKEISFTDYEVFRLVLVH